MPARTICGGVIKSGSPMPRLITSFIVAAMSKKRRMPEGGMLATLDEITLRMVVPPLSKNKTGLPISDSPVS